MAERIKLSTESKWDRWTHAGIRAREAKYFMIAVLYGIPSFLAMIYLNDKQLKTDQTHQDLKDLVGLFYALVWIGGIVHAQVVKKQVNLRIANAGDALVAVQSIKLALRRFLISGKGSAWMPLNNSNRTCAMVGSGPTG